MLAKFLVYASAVNVVAILRFQQKELYSKVLDDTTKRPPEWHCARTCFEHVSHFVSCQTQPFEKIMREYAQKMNASYERLTFQFDGAPLQPRETPSHHDMEGDECIDVIGL